MRRNNIEDAFLDLITDELSEFEIYDTSGAVSLTVDIIVALDLPDGWLAADGADATTVRINKEWSV